MVELIYLENHLPPDNFVYLILSAIVTFLLQISILNLLDVLFRHKNWLKVKKSPLNFEKEVYVTQSMMIVDS